MKIQQGFIQLVLMLLLVLQKLQLNSDGKIDDEEFGSFIQSVESKKFSFSTICFLLAVRLIWVFFLKNKIRSNVHNHHEEKRFLIENRSCSMKRS